MYRAFLSDHLSDHDCQNREEKQRPENPFLYYLRTNDSSLHQRPSRINRSHFRITATFLMFHSVIFSKSIPTLKHPVISFLNVGSCCGVTLCLLFFFFFFFFCFVFFFFYFYRLTQVFCEKQFWLYRYMLFYSIHMISTAYCGPVCGDLVFWLPVAILFCFITVVIMCISLWLTGARIAPVSQYRFGFLHMGACSISSLRTFIFAGIVGLWRSRQT